MNNSTYNKTETTKRVSITPFFTNIKNACVDAERIFQQFIPNGDINPFLNYKLEIKPTQPDDKWHTINITINAYICQGLFAIIFRITMECPSSPLFDIIARSSAV